MNKFIPAVALSLVFGMGFIAAEQATSGDKTVDAVDDEMQTLVKEVYPAFVLIGGGSGVCISKDGYFLTNHHVWSQAAQPAEMMVKMAGNDKRFNADAVGADPRGDIVLGKIRLDEGEEVPFCKLADSDKVRIGDICLAVGNPFLLSGRGSEPTVTLGTVSGKHRFQGGYNDCIQIDTAINPGNSGGPSFNIDGEIIGINGRNIASHNKRYNTGAGYAIPSNQIKNFLSAFMAQEGGALLVRHGLIGGLSIDLSGKGGAIVTEVVEDSDAGHAGIQVDDIIVKIDGYNIFNGYRYYGVISTKPKGSEFKIELKRGNSIINLVASNNVPQESGQFGVVPRSDDIARKEKRGGIMAMQDPFKLPKMRSSLGFKGKYNPDRRVGGYLITGLRETKDGKNPLGDIGMMKGDILLKINGRKVDYFADLHDVMIALKAGTKVSVTYLSNGEEYTADTELGKK